MISDPVVRPKIVKAAGSRITAARRTQVRSPGSGARHVQHHPEVTQSYLAATTSRLTSKALLIALADRLL
jgi:6-phosphogluconolactonase (cycloisomerase 2 family)